MKNKTNTKDYDKFIATKSHTVQVVGFEPYPFTAPLKMFQELGAGFAIRMGRSALFQDTGLGKTRQFAEWAHQVEQRTGGAVVILTKLAVARQTVEEAKNCGITITHIRQPEEIGERGIYVTNYERFDLLVESGVLARLSGIVLDESSVLKDFTGKRSGALREHCAKIPYRLCATATPAPNDFAELGSHAEFLGVMSASQMLATWFINDTGDTGTWRLKKHARDDFWAWVATWAACIFKPSDCGDSDEGYDLPGLEILEHRFPVEQTALETRHDALFDLTVVNAANVAREARRSSAPRASWIAKRVMEHPSEQYCIFVETNEESDTVMDALTAAGVTGWEEVRGSDSPEHKETHLWAFAQGTLRILITKSEVAGFGLNFQRCHRVIFASPDYSFEQWYQAVRRFYRFGQAHVVICDMLRGENMERVADAWRKKMEQFESMKQEMRAASVHLANGPRTGMICKETLDEARGKNWRLFHGDCVRAMRTLPENSVDFSVYSPPFFALFTYSNDVQDMGNTKDMAQFIEQYSYAIREIHRVTAPGRLSAVHCVDLLTTKWKDGEIGYMDFSGEIVNAYRKAGWILWSRITIWKCPVVEMTRTKAHGLLYKTLKKDSANSRTGSAEYLLIFKKRGENTKPIEHREKDLPVSLWQELASPVWMTVDQGDTLNTVKGPNDEKHICPLQLDVIRRALTLWSAPGDMVLSPFAGVGSEGHESLKMGRKFIGAELKPEYFKQACQNLTAAEALASQELGLDMDSNVNEAVA